MHIRHQLTCNAPQTLTSHTPVISFVHRSSPHHTSFIYIIHTTFILLLLHLSSIHPPCIHQSHIRLSWIHLSSKQLVIYTPVIHTFVNHVPASRAPVTSSPASHTSIHVSSAAIKSNKLGDDIFSFYWVHSMRMKHRHSGIKCIGEPQPLLSVYALIPPFSSFQWSLTINTRYTHNCQTCTAEGGAGCEGGKGRDI